jgi:outer membrane receptor protein involved in Fe transport
MTPTIRRAVAVILGAASLAAGVARAADANLDQSSGATSATLTTIIVTAQHRSQNIQDVPITMQALTGSNLRQLNVATFEDYAKYLPNVSVASNGPGQDDVFMRGLSDGSPATQGSGSTGLFPNVGLYLNDQSVALPGRNLDVYAVDLNRIEVLEGPQGTLFGSGAEAGVIRYITNKPDLTETGGSATAGYGVTAGGDPNTSVNAVLNLPLIPGRFAVRAVIYSDSRGGYINNVPATFARKNTDLGIHYANYPAVNGQCPDGQPNNGYCVPPGSPAINNYAIAGNAINPVTYQGGRLEALYKINDDWDILLTQSNQNMDAQGVFYAQPYGSNGQPLPPLSVTLFNPSYNKDRFEDTAWTVHGKVGPLQLVYDGAYLDRHVEQVGDYTNYARGVYADYYQCYGPGSGGEANLAPTCFSPSSIWHDVAHNTDQQEELRLLTPSSWRLRGIAGVYFEDNRVRDQTYWTYKSIPACTSNGVPGTAGNSGCLSNIGTVAGASVAYPGVQRDTTAYDADVVRQVRQLAFYLSSSFDLIPHKLSITLGTRHYQFKNSSGGSVTSSFYCFDAGTPAGGCTAVSYNLNAEGLRDTESGFRSRANLSWHITPQIMVYYTWSQGFRPGGFNFSGGSQHIYGSDGMYQYVLPKAYKSDALTNNELGWKSDWWGHRIQWNGAVYREQWNNAQVAFFDPGLLGNTFFNTNGQNFVVRGLETSVIARMIAGLTLQAAGSWNHSRQVNSPALIDNNPASVNFGKPITESCDANGANCVPVVNPFGPIGAPTADSPPVYFSLRARWDQAFGSYLWYIQAGMVHVGHSYTQAGANPTASLGSAVSTDRLRFEDPAYSTFDAATGISKGAWTVRLYGQNLGNSHTSVFTNSDQFIVAQTVLRPRVIGLSFTYQYGSEAQ